MKIDETLYNEYVNFKLENKEFLENIEKSAEDIFYNFKHVLEVIEFLYNMLIDDEHYGEEQHLVFETGYLHVINIVVDLKELLKDTYNNDYKLLNDHASEINLLLNTYEFQDELKDIEFEETEYTKELLTFDKELLKYIESKTIVPDTLYERLNYLVSVVFEQLNIEFYSINNIFLEISEQLKLL